MNVLSLHPRPGRSLPGRARVQLSPDSCLGLPNHQTWALCSPSEHKKWLFSGFLVFATGNSTREQDPPRGKMILWLLVFLLPDISPGILVASPLQPFGTKYWQDLGFHFHFTFPDFSLFFFPLLLTFPFLQVLLKTGFLCISPH